MTNKLTEQWREGTLKRGSYYIRIITGIEKADFFEGKKFCFWTDYEIEEVLAPVPSYDEWKQAKENIDKNGTWYTERSYKRIEKRLDIATKVLKDYANEDFWEDSIDEYSIVYNCCFCEEGYKDAQEALKQIEELDK